MAADDPVRHALRLAQMILTSLIYYLQPNIGLGYESHRHRWFWYGGLYTGS